MELYKDKTVLITGASRGIGKAIALAYGREKANVIINYLRSKEQAEAIISEIEALGGKAIAIQADVSNFEDAQKLVEQGLQHFGSIDVLINNSGITKDGLIMRMKEDDFDRVIDVNLKGTWNMCKHISKTFLKNRAGKIINISSVVGTTGNIGQSNYAASKAGLIGLTKSLAKEFGGRGINVNCIAPGFIETEMTDDLNDDIKDFYLKQIPLAKLGQPEDIANLCLFLSSDQAAYITSQVIHVNGGMI